jgi:general stress protein YciG
VGTGEEDNVAKEDRGFASMDRAKQREIASKGGKAAHQKGTAHEWTSEEARDAGRKGGIASHQRRREQGGQGSERSTGDDFAVAMDRESSFNSPGSGGVEPMRGSSADDWMSGNRDNRED